MVGSGSQKCWLLVFGIKLLVLLLVSPPPLAAQSGGVTLKVAPFFNGHFKYGEWLPLRITITNTGAAVSAQARVEMTQTSGQTAWLVPVELPGGAQKQITLYVLPPSFAQVARVRVLNGTQELAQENAPLTLHPNKDYLIGVIAPRLEPFNSLGGQVLPGTTPRTLRTLPLTPDDIPERAEGLRSLDALVLTDTDTSGLSPAQTRAMSTWIQDGGRLVLGGGASAARTLAGLPDELVQEFRSENNVVELNALDALGEFGESAVRVEGPFAAAFPTGGAALIQAKGNALVVEKRAGDGLVTYAALDLAASPFDAWAGAARFWTKLVTPGSALPLNGPADVSPRLVRLNYVASALQNLPVLALPSLNALAILLTVYIILVGPVNYFVLRRSKKLDWGWITIPALTLLFALGAFGVTAQLRGSDVILNQISVVDFGRDGRPHEMETAVGLFSPTRGSFNLELPGDSFVIPVSNQYNPISGGVEGSGTKVEIVESSPLLVRGIEINQGALQSFAIESPAPDDWLIESDLNVEGEHVRGVINNGLSVPLEDVVLVNGERFIRLNQLLPNMKREVDQNWQFFGGNVAGLVSGSTPNSEARRQILDARFDSWRGNQRTAAAPMLIGWMDTSPLDVRVQNITATRLAKTLTIVPLNLAYTPGGLHLGANDWRIQEVWSTGERVNCGAVNYMGVSNGNVVLDFLPPVALKLNAVKGLRVLVKETDPQTIELQDADGKWIALDIQSPSTYAAEYPDRFVKSNGAVRMRISGTKVTERCVFYSLELDAEIGE